MEKNQTCKTCLPNNAVQTKTDSKYTLTLNTADEKYNVTVKDDFSFLLILVTVLGLIYLKLTGKKKPSWRTDKTPYQETTYQSVDVGSEFLNGYVRRNTDKPSERKCLPLKV